MSWFEQYPPGHPRAGEPVSRDRVCECGREFTQLMLASGFVSGVRARDLVNSAVLADQLPGGWTPAKCPACEHRALHREPERPARKARRAVSAPRQPDLFEPPAPLRFGAARGPLRSVW
jgi:hypothetical protein